MKNRIKELRKSRGLTLEALAGMVNSSNQHISHLENGRRRLTVDWMERIAKAFQCHPFELLDDHLVAKSKREEDLLDLFRELSDEQQDAFLKAAASVANPVKFQETVGKKDG
jgi:transcriptional regulator with XRE-family HTH domain